MKAAIFLGPMLALGLCAPAAAQERASGFWAGVDLGYGSLRRDLSVTGSRRLGESSFYLTPSLDYSWGRSGAATSPPGVTQDQRFRAVTFRIGLTYR